MRTNGAKDLNVNAAETGGGGGGGRQGGKNIEGHFFVPSLCVLLLCTQCFWHSRFSLAACSRSFLIFFIAVVCFRAAQFEHTILITDQGVEVLTADCEN